MFRAEARVLHDEPPRFAGKGVVQLKRRADCDAVVAGGGLHVDLVEGGLAQEAAVHSAVQRHPPRHAQPLFAGSGVEPAHHAEHGLLENPLCRGREVHVPFLDGLAFLARRAETILELFREVAEP